MNTRFVEATQSAETGFNHGKFMVGWFDDEEWQRKSSLPPVALALIPRCGWTHLHLWVADLQTGEGAFFRVGGSARADLDKHRVWVCPMFEPFLEWLYERVADRPANLPLGEFLETMPQLVELPDAEPSLYGYRRSGPEPDPPRKGRITPLPDLGIVALVEDKS